MDKLKIKHDHKLTDILKVGLFGIFLLLPLLVWLPNALYFGFNEHANNLTKTVAKNEIINFKQHFEYNNFSKDYSYTNNDTRTYIYNGYMWENHIYIISFEVSNLNNPNNNRFRINVGSDSAFYTDTLTDNGYVQYRGLCPTTGNINYMYLINDVDTTLDCTFTFSHYNIFDLTEMFGSGNEPTLEQFNIWFPNNFYEYTTSKYIEIPTNETITVLAATDNMELAWQDIWKLPVFEWTGRNNFNFTINLFTNIFGITEYSYLTNYLTYLLVMTAIYVIFDIILSMFKLVTHLINSKE